MGATKKELNLVEKLTKIQKELKAPKNQYNSFGKYKYRSTEDILEGLKPLLDGCTITINDEIVEVAGRIYVKATAHLHDAIDLDYAISVSAFAREPGEQKGMNQAQITGSASSYARKYALNGLFLIDDTKDADTQDNSTTAKKPTKTDHKKDYKKMYLNASNMEELQLLWTSLSNQEQVDTRLLKETRKKEILNFKS